MSYLFRIQPLGDIDVTVIKSLEDILLATFICDTKVLTPLDMPLHAFSARRNQFSAPIVLRRVDHCEIAEDCKVLAVTSDDLYVKGRNFIFGQAQVNGRCALISLKRLYSSDTALFIDRVRKEAVHEIGHTLGLPHCERDYCVMRFSENAEDTDSKPSTFCDEHKNAIGAYLRG